VQKRRFDQLRRGLIEFFDAGGQNVVLIGGDELPNMTTAHQEDILSEMTKNTATSDLADASKRLSTKVPFKRFNRLQARTVLTQKATDLSEEDKDHFTDFVLARVGSFLRILYAYALPESITSLEDALNFFAHLFSDEERLSRVFKRAYIYPADGNYNEPITPEMQAITKAVMGDVEEYLRKLRKDR
jgi:hypothetical protein